MKNRLAIIGFTVLIFVALAAGAFASNPVKLYVNGREIELDVPPQIVNGRTMMPVTPKGEAETTTTIYYFDGKNFDK
ncbi:MAG: stalk domain-containing protein [Dethiobacteria bacterium]|jgi:hypothetical protein